MATRLIVLLLLATSLGGCSAASNCAGWTPVTTSSKDRFTAGTRDSILKHNEAGVEKGCWTSKR